MKQEDEERARIVVIDDEPDFRKVVVRWLSDRYDTLSFESAEDLLESEEESVEPDLIITDVKMPGLNGFRLCERLRGHPRYAHVPILFLTGVDSDEGFLLGQEAGGSAYLTKPVERDLLLQRVEELLTTRAY